ncbi:hypothetical protein ACFQER_06280 [Halomicroarcula sp. GCM10025894]
MANTQLTEKDEGKNVVNADGDEIGVISDFRGGRPTSTRTPASRTK